MSRIDYGVLLERYQYDQESDAERKQRIEEKGQTPTDFIKMYLAAGKANQDNPDAVALTLAPSGSPLDEVLGAFQTHTDIPLKLPLVSFFSLVATYLLKQNIQLNVKGTPIKMDFWTICLANSGAGKSYAYNKVEKACKQVLGIESEFSQVISDAAFIDTLYKHNNSLWFYDEFAQFIIQLEQGANGSHKLTKEYLLKTYDGKEIERVGKQDSITVTEPCLNILGTNTIESFLNNISEESFTDGFAQRFSYLIAKEDPSRNSKDFAWYSDDTMMPCLISAFQVIKKVKLHNVYSVSSKGWDAFQTSYTELLERYNVPQSFYRRLMFRSWKYALIYHINDGKTTKNIDERDVANSMRFIEQQIIDLGVLLDKYNYSDVAKQLIKIRAFKKKCEAEGRKFNTSTVAQYVRGVGKAHEIKGLMALLDGLTDKDFDQSQVPLSISRPPEKIQYPETMEGALILQKEIDEHTAKHGKKCLKPQKPLMDGKIL